ncbi:Olfactory receptor 2T12 [Manis javanica]|nr:Olfactory receptor 2T12 [Manis javanica]
MTATWPSVTPCYMVLMNQRLCLHMSAGSWLLGAADGLMQAAATLSFPYCRPWEINHFFCEAPSLLRLACADTVVFEFFMYVCCVLMLLIPLSLILASYSLILAAVLLMKSNSLEEGLRHLLLPPGRCGALLRHHHVHLHAAQIPPFSGPRQGGICFLHRLHVCAEPSYLQCQE